MRHPIFTPLLLALSAVHYLTTALPVPEQSIPAADADKPKYSVVPVYGGGADTSNEPEDETSSGGEDAEHGGDPTVTVVETVIRTASPIIETVTHSSPPATVTHTIVKPAKPATKTVVSIIAIQGSERPVATVAAYDDDASPLPPSTSSSSVYTPTPTTISTHSTSIDSTPASHATTVVPLSTGISTTSTPSYDDGMWHTVYPAWNGTATLRYRRRS